MSEAEAAIEQSERLGDENNVVIAVARKFLFNVHISLLRRYKRSNRANHEKGLPSSVRAKGKGGEEINYKIPSLRFRVPSIVSTVPT